jgi:hypothetical protein
LARWIAVAACVAVALGPAAACGTAAPSSPGAGTGSGAGPSSSSDPASLKPSRWPAARAGGVCQSLDYGVVEQTLGLSFEVAAGGQQDATQTCVLQRAGVTVPDLTLAVTPTKVDPTIFRNTVMPKGASALTGLGKAAYQAPVAPAPQSGRGPGAEVGWLSGNNRILVLRCTLPVEAPAEIATGLPAKLVELAKKVDQTP